MGGETGCERLGWMIGPWADLNRLLTGARWNPGRTTVGLPRLTIRIHPAHTHALGSHPPYRDELVRAGVLLAGDLAAGCWLLELDSRGQAAEWGGRVPGGEVGIRQDAGYRPATRPSAAGPSDTAGSR